MDNKSRSVQKSGATPVGAVGEVLAEEAVGVVVGAALPGTLGVAEVDVEVGVCAELCVLGHFGSLVPGQRAAELLGQGGDRRSDGVSDGLGAVTGEGGPVVDPLLFSVAWHGWEVFQHREPGGALHKCPDRGAPKSGDQVTFPVAWHCPVVGLGGALADHDLGADEGAAPLLGPGPGDSQRSPGSPTRHKLAPERTPALHIGRLVDGFVRDSHGLIVGEVDPEPVRDLLGTPRRCPPSILSGPVTATDPAHLGSWHQLAIRSSDLPTQTIRHIVAKGVVRGELRDLRAAGTPLCVPLRSRCPINHTTTTSRRVAAQLTRNRRRATTQAATDLTHPNTLRIKYGDLFPLRKRQITPRHRTQTDRRHPTSLAEPSRPNRRRHPRPGSRVLARDTPSDRFPEPDPILTPRFPRPTRRPHPATHRTNRLLTLHNTHRKPPSSPSVATTN